MLIPMFYLALCATGSMFLVLLMYEFLPMTENANVRVDLYIKSLNR